MVGERIAGKYVVDAILGQGAHGVVVSAEHPELRRPVALKLLRGSRMNADQRERLIREARAAIVLQTEHVVRVMDVGREDTGAPFIVMERLVGRDLGQVLDLVVRRQDDPRARVTRLGFHRPRV